MTAAIAISAGIMICFIAVMVYIKWIADGYVAPESMGDSGKRSLVGGFSFFIAAIVSNLFYERLDFANWDMTLVIAAPFAALLWMSTDWIVLRTRSKSNSD